MACVILIATILAISLVARSYSLENFCKHNCTQFTDTLLCISTFLQFVIHPRNIFILHNCIDSEYVTEDLQVSSNFSLAVLKTSALGNFSADIFHETRPFIVLDLPQEEFANATAWMQNAFKHKQNKWHPTIIILWKESEFQLLEETFATVQLRFDSNIFVVFPESLNILEMYRVNKKRMYSSVLKDDNENWRGCSSGTETANCDENVIAKTVLSLDGFAMRRRNFHLEAFTASVKYDPSYEDWLGLVRKDDGTYTLASGFSTSLYRDLQRLMNYSESVVLGDSPIVLPNGTLAGITVNQLNSEEADISLNMNSLSTHRAKALTFLQPTFESIVYVFFKQPSANSIRDIVTAAFARELWFTLIGAWAFLVISIHVRLLVMPKSLPYSSFPWTNFAFSQDQRFIKESVLWSVAAVCQKSWYLDPSSASLRIKVMVGSLFSLILYTAYSASIVSSLAVNKIPVKTFMDLINFNFVLTVHEYSEPFQTMLRGMIKTYGMDQGVVTTSTEREVSHLFTGSDLHSSKKGFLSSADMFYTTAKTLNYSDIFTCKNIASNPVGTVTSKSGMLVKKGSQYREILNHMLIYMRECGLINRYIQLYNAKNILKCVQNDQGTVEPAMFSDVWTIFFSLFVGTLATLVALILEFMHHFCTQCRPQYNE